MARAMLFLSTALLALVLSEAKVQDVSTGQPATSLSGGKKCVYSTSSAHAKNGNDGKLTNNHPNTYHSCCLPNKASTPPIVYTVKLKTMVKNPDVHFHTRDCCNGNFGNTVWFYLSDSPTNFGKNSCKVLTTKDNGKYNFKCDGQGTYIHVVAKKGSKGASSFCLDFAEVTVKGTPYTPPKPTKPPTKKPQPPAALCSNAKWKVKSLAPVKERSGFPATNAFDGKAAKDAGNSFISMTSKDLTVVLDLGQTETFSSARFYGVNDGDQAEHAVILCGNVPSGKGKKGVAEVDIPRKPVWVSSPKFKCTSQYVTFYVRDAHSHSANIRLSEIQLYGCTVKCKCDNGTPTTGPGPRCPTAGLNRCRSCNKGFTLDTKTSACVKNKRLGQCSLKSPLPKLDMNKPRRGVHVVSDDSIVTLGKNKDVVLVRTGDKAASLVGDITVRGRLSVNCEDIGDKFEAVTQSCNTQMDGLRNQMEDLRKEVQMLKAELAKLKK